MHVFLPGLKCTPPLPSLMLHHHRVLLFAIKTLSFLIHQLIRVYRMLVLYSNVCPPRAVRDDYYSHCLLKLTMHVTSPFQGPHIIHKKGKTW
jgi:hypothetical protein